jgi:cobaltochelatase CobN
MGWAIMRDGSVSDDTWNEIAAIYVNDKLGLSMRSWFETQNPYAFQDMTEVMLESSRKGLWHGQPGLVRQVAEQYARSVLRHGEGGGLRGGGNLKLEQFVAAALQSAKSPELDRLAAQYQDRIRAGQVVQVAGTAPGPGHVSSPGREPGDNVAPPPLSAPAKSSAHPAASPPPAPAAVIGAKRLEPAPPAGPHADEEPGPRRWPLVTAISVVVLLLVLGGFFYRKGMP